MNNGGMRFVGGMSLLACLVTVVACGNASKTPTTTVTLPPPTVPTTLAPVSALTISGVGPGVNQTPFYPTTTVTKITCGPVPGGVFVAIGVPPGGAPTPTGSALAAATRIVVVPGHAVLKDNTGKVLYDMKMPSIQTSRQGAFVLSLESVTYIGGDRRSVAQGAVNVSGDYACPATDSPYPGL